LEKHHNYLAGYEEKHLTFLSGNRTQEKWTNAQKPSDFMFKDM
jgi:phenylalanyl-tRNA synthetase beta chain